MISFQEMKNLAASREVSNQNLGKSFTASGGELNPKRLREEDVKQGRDIKFRLQIVPLYHYSCALCRIKILLPSGITLVEAAHIHQFAQSKNDDITNGMALCRNHHWAFDQGLWSINPDFG